MPDPTLLDTSEVELVDLKMLEEEPIVVVQFTCQQINCTRDSFGNVVDGQPDEVQRCGAVGGWVCWRRSSAQHSVCAFGGWNRGAARCPLLPPLPALTFLPLELGVAGCTTPGRCSRSGWGMSGPMGATTPRGGS